MGCWNETCVVTNLPIQNNEEAVIFPLVAIPFVKDGYCYPDSYYARFPLHFFGTYNSYGGFDNCHGIGLKLLQDALELQLIERPTGDNEYHDIAVNRAEIRNVEKMFELHHEGRLYIKNSYLTFASNNQFVNNPELLEIVFVYIKKSVYNEIVNNYTIESYISTSSDYEIRNLKFSDWLTAERLRHYSNDSSYIDHIVKKSITAEVDKYTMFSFDEQKQKLIPPVPFDIKITENELLMNYMISQWINILFVNTRRMWIKPSGQGGQDYDVKSYQFLNNMINNELLQELNNRDAD